MSEREKAAVKVREEAEAQAWKTYEKDTVPARKAYQKAVAQAWRTYQKTLAAIAKEAEVPE